jgi:hypothetical protein
MSLFGSPSSRNYHFWHAKPPRLTGFGGSFSQSRDTSCIKKITNDVELSVGDLAGFMT